MASEDSDQLRSGLLMVHGLRDPHYLDQPLVREVPIRSADLDALGKLHKVALLCGEQRMLPEERDDHREEIRSSHHYEVPHVLLVVVMAAVDVQPPNPKEVSQPLKGTQAARSLYDCE